MLTPSLRPSRFILLALAVSFSIGSAFTQDNPNRPPWAQKSKAQKSKTASNSSSGSNSTTTASAPTAPPDGEPGKIVQPTPPPPNNQTHESDTPHRRIPAHATLRPTPLPILY